MLTMYILYLLILICSGAADNIYSCEDTLRLHTYGSIQRECYAVQCDAGTQAKMCTDSGLDAYCEPCPIGTFKDVQTCSTEERLCIRHRQCSLPHYILVTPGTSTSNNVCECNFANGYVGSDYTACSKQPPCAPGQYMTRTGCKTCPPNTRTLTPNYALQCIDCLKNPAECYGNATTTVVTTGTMPELPDVAIQVNTYYIVAAILVIVIGIAVLVVVLLVQHKKKSVKTPVETPVENSLITRPTVVDNLYKEEEPIYMEIV